MVKFQVKWERGQVKLFGALVRPFSQTVARVGLLSIVLTADRGFENMGGSV